jgi:hypothetical protein
MNREFTAILVEAMKTVLKPRGFRARGPNFQRSRNDLMHLVQLQKSMASTAAVVRATVNLAVWIPLLADRGEPPSVAAAPYRERIGSLMPGGQDLWWEIGSAVEAEASGFVIAGALERFGLPWLDAIESTDSVLAQWEAGRAPGITDRHRTRLLERLRLLRGRMPDNDAVERTGARVARAGRSPLRSPHRQSDDRAAESGTD